MSHSKETGRGPAETPEHETSLVDRYRREAADLRRAVELIHDDGLRKQLLAIADQYERVAADIERRFQQTPAPKAAVPPRSTKRPAAQGRYLS